MSFAAIEIQRVVRIVRQGDDPLDQFAAVAALRAIGPEAKAALTDLAKLSKKLGTRF